MHNLISKYNVILELGRDEERELSLQLGGRKTFLSSPPPHKLYAGSNKRQNQYPDLRSHSWYKTLQLWTELLQIKQAKGPGLPLADAPHEDSGRLVRRERKHVFWKEAFFTSSSAPLPPPPNKSSPTHAWHLPSASGSRVWIMSWKMLFLMRLLWREAELPPRWRRGLAWAEKPEKSAVSSPRL